MILSQALPLSTVTRLGAYSPGAGGEDCVDVGRTAPPRCAWRRA